LLEGGGIASISNDLEELMHPRLEMRVSIAFLDYLDLGPSDLALEFVFGKLDKAAVGKVAAVQSEELLAVSHIVLFNNAGHEGFTKSD